MEDLQTSHKLFHSFCIKPATRFDTQGADEEVILVLRAHPVTLIPILINGLVLFFILFFTNFFLPSFLTLPQILFINAFFLVFLANYLWFGFLNWYFNVGIITNKGIVDVDFNLVIEPGIIEVMVGSSSDDIRLHSSFEIMGSDKSIIQDRIFVCPVEIKS